MTDVVTSPTFIKQNQATKSLKGLFNITNLVICSQTNGIVVIRIRFKVYSTKGTSSITALYGKAKVTTNAYY